MCYKKRSIKNRVLESHKTGFDKEHINVNCNSCPACRKVRANDWLVRSYFEFLGNHRQAFFVSLDFDEEHLPRYNGVPCFDSEVIKKFLKRLRYYIGSFRYFYSTDYGGFLKRPHYHIIVIPDQHISLTSFFGAIKSSWQQGHYTNVESIDCVNNNKLKAISYVVGYACKDITYSPDCKPLLIPPRFRPRCQASKGFGLRALEECLITSDMLLSGARVSIPIGRNGRLVSFQIPRYYEMKLGYNSTWIPDKMKQEVIKNALGVEIAKNRHNRHYVYLIKSFFSSRLNHLEKRDFYNESIFVGRDWRSVVYDCLTDFSDFSEFVYYRPFITFQSNTIVIDNLRNEQLLRPSWSFYEAAFQAFQHYNQELDDVKCRIETEKLIEAAKERARKRLRDRPALFRYLVSKNYDFSQLYVKSKVS